jgi:GNAT superfamily N-acetyltransferase
VPRPGELTAEISRSSSIERTPRVLQLQGLFDVPIEQKSSLTWSVRLPLQEKPWNVGLIVGPSGCGKSTIARELWPREYVRGFKWARSKSVLDSFPGDLSIKEITLLLSSVGFSSPPSWLRPFHVLSNGEQFRTMIARALCVYRRLCVVDEFTSVVDRTVARIGSAAIAKAVRRRGSKFIAVTCHYDVEAWLDPDWIYEPATNRFRWRSLRGRPAIELEVGRVTHHLWSLFAPHHYLSADLNKAAVCFAAFLEGQPVAFEAWLPFFGRLTHGKARRDHRRVCLPDYQGVGIGNALFERDAAMWASMGFRVFSGTGHPGEIAHRMRSPNWRMTSAPTRHAADTGRGGRGLASSRATNRLVASFEYKGRSLPARDARRQFEGWVQICSPGETRI